MWLAGCAAPQVSPPPEHLEKGVVFIKRLRAGRVIGTASGVIVSSDGKMATSRHVVFHGNADVLLARTWDRKEHIVLGVLAVHPTVDLALLQLEPADYSPVRLAPEAAIRPGDPIRVGDGGPGQQRFARVQRASRSHWHRRGS
ncbi:MAG: serine protease [Verrucomicrobia bacterium]|nr:serine protease [Verrucomicrobiota bacterium]